MLALNFTSSIRISGDKYYLSVAGTEFFVSNFQHPQLKQCLLINIEEMDKMSQREIAKFKDAVTSSTMQCNEKYVPVMTFDNFLTFVGSYNETEGGYLKQVFTLNLFFDN